MSNAERALDRLPEDARDRLEAFARALDHVHVDDLTLYVARVRQPRHRRAAEQAELVAIDAGLGDAVRVARETVVEGLMRILADRQFRVWIGGVAMAPNLGPVDDRIRIARSVADATTAMVLGDALEPDVRAELLGLWDRLLP